MMIGSGGIVKVDILKLNLTLQIIDCALTLVRVLVNCWLSIYNIKGQLASNSSFSHGLYVRGSHAD